MTAQNRKREEILFELLNSSLAQLGPERSNARRDSFEANGALCTKLIKLDKLPPSTTQSPSFWEVLTLLLTGAYVKCFTISPTRKAGGICCWGQAFCELYRFLSATLFERVPRYGPWKQSTAERLSRKW